MPGRRSLVHKLCLISTLALLVWMPSTPNRNSELVAVSRRPDCLINRPVPPQVEPMAHLGGGMADGAVFERKAPAWEEEEQDSVDALHEPRVSFLNTCSFRKAPALHVISPRAVLSHYPIRC